MSLLTTRISFGWLRRLPRKLAKGAISLVKNAFLGNGIATRLFLGFLGMSLAFFLTFVNPTLLFPPQPTIELKTPEADSNMIGDKLFVKGTVSPVGSEVRVNDKAVSQNGDGSFTSIITIPEGKSVLAVEATYRGKKSALSQLITRTLTTEEQQLRTKENQETELLAKQKVLGVDQKISDLLSVYSNGSASNPIKLLSQDLQKQVGLKYITGEVINVSSENAYWVKVTANFFNENNVQIDSKSGFAVSGDAFVKPGGTAKFQTQSTTMDFSYYKIVIESKSSNVVSGAAVVPEASFSATPSAKPVPAQ